MQHNFSYSNKPFFKSVAPSVPMLLKSNQLVQDKMQMLLICSCVLTRRFTEANIIKRSQLMMIPKSANAAMKPIILDSLQFSADQSSNFVKSLKEKFQRHKKADKNIQV